MRAGTDTPETQERTRTEVGVSTLLVAAVASVVAAIVTSKLWASGTLISTAMTPVIVSLVREYLQRPVERIGAVARAPIVAVRSGSTAVMPAAARRGAPPEAERRGVLLEDRPEPDREAFERLDAVLPPGEDATSETPYRVYRRRTPARRVWWRAGLATGLAAFLVAVAVVTLPELVGGGSVAGSGRTTLFSGHKTASSAEEETAPATPSERERSTPAAPSSSSPASQAPSATTPAPTTSTPAPSTSTPQAPPAAPATPPATSTPAPAPGPGG